MSVVPPTNESYELDFFGRKVGYKRANGPKMPPLRHPALIIAELSINHGGSVQMAMEMIKEAADAGVDAVKLQLRDLKACYGDMADDQKGAPSAMANYIPILKKTELPIDSYAELKEYAESLGLGFLVTPFDEPSVEKLEEINLQAYKIGSCDAVNPWLLDAVAKTGKPFIVSLGMCTEGEVFTIVDHLRSVAPRQFALMHTVSAYPTAFKDCQIHMIGRMKHNLACPVGWSGHERGVAVSCAAVAQGADIIEKHFTLDRSLPGPDQAVSLEPDGLRKLVARVRAFEEAYGDPFSDRRRPRSEFACDEVMRKSLWVKKSVPAGEIVTRDHLEVRGPGRGMTPISLFQIEKRGLMASKDLVPGDQLLPEHLTVTKKKEDANVS